MSIKFNVSNTVRVAVVDELGCVGHAEYTVTVRPANAVNKQLAFRFIMHTLKENMAEDGFTLNGEIVINGVRVK